MKRGLQAAALSGALVCAVAAAVAAAAWQGHGRTVSTPINPAVTYAKNCATCHGKSGRGDTFKSRRRYHARDLTDAHWQAEATDERIFNAILNGVGKMPAFGKKLTREQITSLVPYVRDLKK
jgi:mono/diheme cytochrome c family protein